MRMSKGIEHPLNARINLDGKFFRRQSETESEYGADACKEDQGIFDQRGQRNIFFCLYTSAYAGLRHKEMEDIGSLKIRMFLSSNI